MNQAITKTILVAVFLLNVCYAPIAFIGVYNSMPRFLPYTFLIGAVLSFMIIAPMVFINLKLRMLMLTTIILSMAVSLILKLNIGHIYSVIFPASGLALLASQIFHFKEQKFYSYLYICITFSMVWLYLYGSVSNYIFLYFYYQYLQEEFFWPYNNGKAICNALLILANVSLVTTLSVLFVPVFRKYLTKKNA